jgi:hypothetical protein
VKRLGFFLKGYGENTNGHNECLFIKNPIPAGKVPLKVIIPAYSITVYMRMLV